MPYVQLQVHVTVDGKGDAQPLSNITTTPPSPGSPFLVNITAHPAAAMVITALEPSTLSLSGLTLLNLGLNNLPGFVLTDYSGQVSTAAASTGFSQGFVTGFSSSLYTGDVSMAAAAASEAASSTSNCKHWLSFSIAGVDCPILSCIGNASNANVTALFPGHLVNASAVDPSGLVNATLTVMDAAGSTVVTRRRLAALRHPPLLHIPPRPTMAAAIAADDELAGSEGEAEQGFVSQLFDQLEDAVETAAEFGSSVVQELSAVSAVNWGRIKPRVEGVVAAGQAAVSNLWTKYVVAPRQRHRFRQAVELQGEASRVQPLDSKRVACAYLLIMQC